MEINLQEHRRRYEATMEAGAAEYADVIERLNAEGLPTHFTQTGGMNAALEVQLETGQTLLITDANDSLSWDRREQEGWSVGLYRHAGADDTSPIRFATIEDVSIPALWQLIDEVLFSDLKPDP